jgi:hypothetical protein
MINRVEIEHSDMDDMIHLVKASSGEYDSYREWICGAFTSLTEAELLSQAHKTKAMADRDAYNAWCEKRSPYYWEAIKELSCGLLTDAQEQNIIEKIGARPNDGWEADDFEVMSIPLNTWIKE